MYAPVGQQEGGMERVANESDWRTDCEPEYSKFIDPSVLQQLEDLPRATSAPPHLQDRIVGSADLLNRMPTLEGMDSYTDIRYDEDYAAFYEMNADKGRLPPPVDGNVLFKDVHGYMGGQPYKDSSAFSIGPPGSRYGGPSHSHAFGPGLASQHSLGRGGLETVKEQPYGSKSSVDESLANALSQLQMGSGIQRPGSQPAPNFVQAAMVADAGHMRSASAFPRFDVDAFANMAANLPPSASSPAPLVANDAPVGAPVQQGNSYLTDQQLDIEAAYKAAYQAALMQSQNNPQVVMPQTGLNVAPNNFHNGMSPHAVKTEMPPPALQQERDPALQNYYGPQAPQQTDFSAGSGASGGGGGGGHRYEVYSTDESPMHHPRGGKRGGRGKLYSQRDRDREMSYPGNDPYYESQYFKFSSIEEVVGQVLQVAKDQHGCRFLQRKFDEGRAPTIAYVFPEILENIVHLMKDPFGNYLIQKLLDRCSEEQRTDVVKAVAEKGELVNIALSTHGTRAVQKLIETLNSKEQRQLAIAALEQGVVHLIKDLNGNHVVQRCLQRLGPEDSQFIYDAAIGCCVDIASHRHGCCVLQRCIDFATQEQRQSLVREISVNALVLSQDAFGNYVVQYVLDLGQPDASQRIMTNLAGHYSELAVQKFSSNVVEKCLKLGGLEDAREQIIREIMASPNLSRLLQDAYGNYVIQSALTVTSGSLHQSLVECIRPFLPTLRGTPHGKRILQKVLASLKDPFQP